MSMTEDTEYLSIPGHVPVRKVAETIGISEDRVLQHIHSGRLPASKVGGRYVIPKQAMEDFKRNPPGRIRKKPPLWRVHDSRIKLLVTEMRVQVRAGQGALFEQKLQTIYEGQQHTFTGTAQRFIFKNTSSPELVTILLLWKDNEMPDEATQQRELAAFKAAFADVLDWETAEMCLHEGMIYT